MTKRSWVQGSKEGLQRSLVSKQAVSEATTDFFNDLCYHSSKFLTTIEQNFTEQSAREEKLAEEKIAAILRTLTSNKAYMVSKAMRNMDTENTEVKKMLEQEMVNIQNISADARKEWKGYIEKVESQFLEDTFLAAETKAAIESNLRNESLQLDHEAKKEIESLSHLCLDQLKSVQYNHGEGISGIRNNADQCLRKEYSVRLLGTHSLLPISSGLLENNLEHLHKSLTR
ncbi:hypothetical protein GIB67_037530 [Kingdonia uniflora]|uniref:Uncharacterized protein n=1 Tax=Kingdonia uniflora TaxID=39325 RepID=A0A7J7NBA2_9MAGN|nr:hypothetical protein GIB67_037530 [Kingdonia uniflora]